MFRPTDAGADAAGMAAGATAGRSTYRDRYQEALQQLIEAKMKGGNHRAAGGVNAIASDRFNGRPETQPCPGTVRATRSRRLAITPQ